MSRVPVTVITGFLGAGKTTLKCRGSCAAAPRIRNGSLA